MSDNYDTGSEGERLLAVYLTAHGRVVTPSNKKEFDLVVDGRYAEVKSSKGPYSKLDFICLTENQYKALTGGVDFSIFIVCNLKDPANLEGHRNADRPASSGEAKDRAEVLLVS